MSTNLDDGGPAFPVVFEHAEASAELFGVTVRDYFAAHAPLPPPYWMPPGGYCDTGEGRLIAWRWHYADLMLKARAAK